MGCWGTISVPPSHSVTGRFVLPSSDSLSSASAEKTVGPTDTDIEGKSVTMSSALPCFNIQG